MRLRRTRNRLRLSLDPVRFTSRQDLGMQPKLLYPRRTRFAPFVEILDSSSIILAPRIEKSSTAP